jgi:hypothetical protein
MDEAGWQAIEAAAKAEKEDVSTYIRRVLSANAKRVLARK